MNTTSLKEQIIAAANNSTEINGKNFCSHTFESIIDAVLESFSSVKPLPWKTLQYSKGLQAVTPFGSYCIAHTTKGIEISNTFPGYRKAPKQFATTIAEAKEMCQKDLAKRLKGVIELEIN
jgi:hypothetical protein